MTRTARLALLVALTLVAATAVAAPAQAAKRKVPSGFFGTTLISELVSPQQISDAALDQQMALMASSGVESLRATIGWGQIEPARGTYNWSVIDRLVLTAARHRIRFLVNISASPAWASSRPLSPESWRYPPKDPATYAEAMREAVKRYGPRGSLWAQNPGVPRVPVREWQVWNEQMAPWFWVPRPWAPSYVKLLKKAYKAIHKVDRKAKVIAGSLMSYGNYHQWDGIRDMYKNGAKGYFDEVAVHPFTNHPKSPRVVANHTLEIVQLVRKVMRKHGEPRKPIAVTEMTWAAALGIVPNGALFGMETTASGQAARLKASYRKLARQQRRMHISGVYWFTWATDYVPEGNPTSMSFRFAGLVKVAGSVYTPLPVLKTYAGVAAKYEGCRKGTNGRCSR